jgi:hypothetical protein
MPLRPSGQEIACRRYGFSGTFYPSRFPFLSFKARWSLGICTLTYNLNLNFLFKALLMGIVKIPE